MYNIGIDGMANNIGTEQGESGIGEYGQTGEYKIAAFFADQLQEFLQDLQVGRFLLLYAYIIEVVIHACFVGFDKSVHTRGSSP